MCEAVGRRPLGSKPWSSDVVPAPCRTAEGQVSVGKEATGWLSLQGYSKQKQGHEARVA